MAERTIIGAGSVVRGNVRGDGDLEIAGRVEGVIDITGELLLLAGGAIQASARASRIIVRGTVSGDLIGETSVQLEAGARVIGDVRSPSISMAEGAMLRGRLETETVPTRDALPQLSRPSQLPAVSSAPVAERRPAVIKTPAPAPVQKSAPATPIGAVAVVRGVPAGVTPAPQRTAPGPQARTTAPAPPPPMHKPVPPAPLTTRAAQSESSRGVAAHVETTRAAETEARDPAPRPPPPVVPALRKPMKGALRKTRGAE